MSSIISYALWGHANIYNRGVISNVVNSQKFYPGWVCRVYCASTSPAYDELMKLPHCEVIPFIPIKNSWTNLMWRYYAASDADVCIFRDADARLSDKESKAVGEWLSSDKALHVMHDDEAHYRWPICGGMWGVKDNWLKNIKIMAEKWMTAKNLQVVPDKELAVDEVFLSEVIWPMFRWGNHMSHGNSVESMARWGGEERPFPEHLPLEIGRYIGQTIFEMERRNVGKFFFFRSKPSDYGKGEGCGSVSD